MGNNKLDITSTLLESTVDGAKGFLGKLLGASVEEYGLMMADNVKLRRFKNQLKMVTKAQKIVEESGINIKQISIKQLVPLLEYSSLEEDESMQDKWANMLVNFADSNHTYASSIFPFILNQLSSSEAKFLDSLYIQNKTNQYSYERIIGVEKFNLIRLGLIEAIIEDKKPAMFAIGYYEDRTSSNRVKITDLGIEFIKCCSSK